MSLLSKQGMSEEAKANIARGMKESALRRENTKRAEAGMDPLSMEEYEVLKTLQNQQKNQIQTRSIGSPVMLGNNPNVRKPVDIKLLKINELQYDPDIFVPMLTGKLIDKILSTEGGLPKAINFIVIGDPGVGKSTVTLDLLSDLSIAGYSCLFISAEMNRIDLYKYVQRYPKFGDVTTLFLGEYIDDNPMHVIEEVIDQGWDVVLIDSFVEVQSDVKESNNMSTNAAESWLIDLMVKNNLGGNQQKKYTTFLPIQQMNKGGTFVGSNKLKHNTTGMLELRFEDQEDQLRPYAFFSKNRRGSVGKRIHFDLSHKDDVVYDEKKYQIMQDVAKFTEAEIELKKTQEDNFDEMFLGKKIARPDPIFTIPENIQNAINSIPEERFRGGEEEQDSNDL